MLLLVVVVVVKNLELSPKEQPWQGLPGNCARPCSSRAPPRGPPEDSTRQANIYPAGNARRSPAGGAGRGGRRAGRAGRPASPRS